MRNLRPIIAALTCLLILSLIIPMGISWLAQPAPKVKAGQQTQTQALGIQQTATDLSATTTAQARMQAILAAQARVQATAGITAAIGAGTVLYEDDLTTQGGGWVDDGYQCYFSPQGYHVRSYAAPGAAWCYSNQQQFSNVVITAQAQLLRGDFCGLIFRLSPHSSEFYVLEINSNGDYRFVRALSNDPHGMVDAH